MHQIYVRPVSVAAFTALTLAACGVAGDDEVLTLSFAGASTSSNDSAIAIESTLRVSARRFGHDEGARGVNNQVQLDGMAAPGRIGFDIEPNTTP